MVSIGSVFGVVAVVCFVILDAYYSMAHRHFRRIEVAVGLVEEDTVVTRRVVVVAVIIKVVQSLLSSSSMMQILEIMQIEYPRRKALLNARNVIVFPMVLVVQTARIRIEWLFARDLDLVVMRSRVV